MTRQPSINIGIALHETDQIADPTAGHPGSGKYWETILNRIEGHADFVTLYDQFGTETTGFDALLLANRLGPVTKSIGIIAGAVVNYNEPFHVSTSVATLDYVTRGRAGLLAQRLTPEDAETVSRVLGELSGFPATSQADIDEDATDAVEVISRLWDSWEDGAVIRDPVSQRFVDGEKLHYIDFRGKRFNVLGPSIVPRPPQGRPVISTIARNRADLEFAATAAELVFLQPGETPVGEFLTQARSAAQKAGSPQKKFFLDVAVHFDSEATISQPAIRWSGPASSLAGQVESWREDGFDGFRFIPHDRGRDLSGLTEVVLPALKEAGLFSPGETTVLRDRLGLAAAPNRYSRVA